MKKIVTVATLAFISLFTTSAMAAKTENMSDMTLLECANASNIRTAVPEHRAMFRHYLMTKRGYTFSQLSSAESEFKAKGIDEGELTQFYQSECKEAGEQLYNAGY
ncbi:hypothetical protein ACPV4A_02575 [Vibrio rotiferianus]|uniref:hypothetical protein n=1 Tax=Vibrio rotiferianus TaxID=190895 RepID=UPI00406AAF21